MKRIKQSGPIIELQNISKKFSLIPYKPTLVETVMKGFQRPKFSALSNISLSINAGDCIGLMGPNGSGKSTLLRIISGITKPTSGRLIIRGRVVSLIELAAGMHPDQTGIENVWLNGMLIGMSASDIKKKLQWIIRYADIGKFIYQPVYMYSEGMLLRLAIAIVFAHDADIYVFDENIYVGDKQFFEKVISTIKGLVDSKKTIIIASHQQYLFDLLNMKIIGIESGRIVSFPKLAPLSL